MADHIAFLGKGGVGKTTLAANISASLVEAGFKVMLVGCDFDGDTCSLLHGGFPVPSIRDRIRKQLPVTAETVVHSGFKGISCVELGDPGNAGTCISAEVAKSMKELKQLQLFERINPDYVLYDISAENSYAALYAVMRQVDITRLFVITTADYKSVQASNDLFRFLEQYNGQNDTPVLMGGLILNNITNSFEDSFVNDFAYKVNARVTGKIPRSLVVRQCELYGQTVIESQPNSHQSYCYRSMANRIVDASMTIYSGNMPRPLSPERLHAWSFEWAERINALENGLVADGAAI